MKKILNSIGNYLSNVKMALNIIYAASPKHFVRYMIISILLVILSYIPIRLWRRLLNALSDFVTGADASLLGPIAWFTAGYCLVHILSGFLQATMTKVSYQYNDEVAYYVDNLLVNKISGAGLSFFDSSKLADNLLNTTKYMRFTLQRIVLLVFTLIKDAIKIVVSLGLIWALEPWLIPFVLLLSLPTILLDRRAKADGYAFNKAHRSAQRRLDYDKSLFFEKSRLEVKVYDLSDFLSDRYRRTWEDYHRAQRHLNLRNCLRQMLSQLLITGSEVVTYLFAIAGLVAHTIGVGEVSYYITISKKFRGDFTSMFGSINEFRQLSLQLDDIMEFNRMQAETDHRGNLEAPEMPKITFENVTFKYPGSDDDVLKHCSFTIQPGEKVGLVGLNGAGKSTIVKLLLQFYAPSEGRILIDDIDASEYDLSSLRRRFGVLFQGYCKYSFTLRENIALADSARMTDDRAIHDACTMSRVTDFIGDWSAGIDENLTRKFDPAGKELSGGQWQRISLARAFFRDAAFLLLDEPSAALDPVAEHEIFEQIAQLSAQKSALLISHRLSSLTLSDRILVLEDGHIVEEGSHADLMRLDGRYAYLFGLQASKYA